MSSRASVLGPRTSYGCRLEAQGMQDATGRRRRSRSTLHWVSVCTGDRWWGEGACVFRCRSFECLLCPSMIQWQWHQRSAPVTHCVWLTDPAPNLFFCGVVLCPCRSWQWACRPAWAAPGTPQPLWTGIHQLRCHCRQCGPVEQCVLLLLSVLV